MNSKLHDLEEYKEGIILSKRRAAYKEQFS